MESNRAETKQTAYLIPVKLARAIRVAAAEQGVYPAKIVERACAEYLGQPSRRKRQTA